MVKEIRTLFHRIYRSIFGIYKIDLYTDCRRSKSKLWVINIFLIFQVFYQRKEAYEAFAGRKKNHPPGVRNVGPYSI